MKNNHTSELAWIALKAEMLKMCIDDIAFGIKSKGIDPESLTEIPARGIVPASATRKKLDALEALRFLRGAAGEKFCGTLGIDPSAVIRRGRTVGTGVKGGSSFRASTGSTRAKFDLAGQEFGSLTAVRVARMDPGGTNVWECRCACGKLCERFSYDLRRGRATHCGCRKEALSGRRGAEAP